MRLVRLMQGSSLRNLSFAPILFSVFLAGCGGGSAGPLGTAPGGVTSVTILTTSDANDQITNFFLAIGGIELTSDTGTVVSLLTQPQYAEFIHVNGKIEPLTTVSVPQATYVSAKILPTSGGSDFLCYSFDPSSGDVDSNTFGYGQVPDSDVTVSLPKPITIAGASTGLLLNLKVSKSTAFSSCGSSDETYSITPTFELSAVNFPVHAANLTLRGIVGGIDAADSGFSLVSANIPLWVIDPAGPTWQISTSGATAYQGISGPSQITAGIPVEVDASIQMDGSLLATRVASYDPNSTEVSASYGPMLFVSSSEPVLYASGSYEQGVLPFAIGLAPFSFGNARFAVSAQFDNLQNLPFPPSFAATNMIAGQNVWITAHVSKASPPPTYMPASTITLLPQTIDGTISSISSEGDFTTYTITLAPYDIFLQLAVQSGQTTLLTSPDTVVVYADDNTQMLNTNPIAAGSVVRFYGLVFNDNGTLRMDCAQINDGVPE